MGLSRLDSSGTFGLWSVGGSAHPETALDDRRSRYGFCAPKNLDLADQGSVTARSARQLSLYVPAVELLVEVGPAQFRARVRNVGADGVEPLIWLVDGVPLGPAETRYQSTRTPDGSSFVRVTLVDGQGGTGSETERLGRAG